LVIKSTQNPRVKALLALRRRPGRRLSELMLVDGYDELTVGLASGARATSLYYSPELVREQGQLDILNEVREQGTEVFQVSEQVFQKIAYRQAPDGWLAVFPAIATDLGRLMLRREPLVLVCESVEKPGNLGAMLRTADAAGVDAVISTSGVTDWGNPNIVRASRGAIFSVPVAEAGREELIPWLRGHGLGIVTTSPDSQLPYTSVDLRRGVAIVVGAESQGLDEEWSRAADAEVRIPMFGRLNSLNVATSAALLIYEAARQRGRLQPT
jgi:RNA methyltransferase, TrmH family